MKILLISNYQHGIGGINAQVDLLHTYLNRETCIIADIFSTKGNPLRRCIAFFLLLCKARRYDVLHIHACSYWGMVPAVMGVIAGKLWRKRIIITYHGGGAEEYFDKHAAFVRRWLGRANRVIVLSGFLKEIFDQYDIPCVVIPNIVVLQPPIKRNTDIAPKFISIRHLEPLYNILCILRAYEQVLKVYPDATLDILGRGSQREELEAYIEEHHLTGVTFVGQVPNQHIYDYLANADVMLSAAKADNMPVSLLEAMNAGLLVISSRVGGVPYMINEVKGERLKVKGIDECKVDSVKCKGEENGKADTPASTPYTLHPIPTESSRLIASSPHRLNKATGLLFESDNSDELAEKMLWALEHPEEVNTIIHNAQAEVQKYSWNNVKQQLMKIYE